MAQIPNTRDVYVGDGMKDTFQVTFQYQQQDEVFVTVDGLDAAFTFISGGWVQLSAAPAYGAEVIVFRSTGAFSTRHTFENGVPLLPRYIDENNKQFLYLAQEAVETSDRAEQVAVDTAGLVQTAVDDAAAAVLASAGAVQVANDALASAQDANDTADAAALVANGVAGTGQGALDAAAAATLVANKAKDTADLALGLVAEAGVQTFNGRAGVVVPESGDYTAEQITRGAGTVESALSDVEDAVAAVGTFAEQNRDPLLWPRWCPNRDAIPAGFVAADGQTLSRSTYPDAWASIAAGNVPTVADATWNSTPTERGKFTAGDGSTNFRLPDYNGKFAGSLGAVFMRGDGTLSAGQAGVIQRDALQNITGGAFSYVLSNKLSGAFAGHPGSAYYWPEGGTLAQTGVDFDASRVARTASETRPLNVTGCWVIKLFGAVVNVGSADAAQLASDYANLAGHVSTLQSMPGLGWNQTWQNVTASRSINTTYTNTAGRPIMVSVRSSVDDGYSQLTVSGIVLAASGSNGGGQTGNLHTVCAIVPNGSTYSYAGSAINTWAELR